MARKAGLGLAVEKEETVRVGVGGGESAEAKYLGVWIPDLARDTAEKVARARKQMDWYAKAWKGKQVGGTKGGKGLSIGIRRAVMRAGVIEGLLYVAGTRGWSAKDMEEMRQVEGEVVRKVFGVTGWQMRRYGIHTAELRDLLGWVTMEERIEERGLRWAGHVARMKMDRRPKQAAFGWHQGGKKRTGGRKGSGWAAWLEGPGRQVEKGVLAKWGIDRRDWFRMAQDKKEWKAWIDRGGG